MESKRYYFNRITKKGIQPVLKYFSGLKPYSIGSSTSECSLRVHSPNHTVPDKACEITADHEGLLSLRAYAEITLNDELMKPDESRPIKLNDTIVVNPVVRLQLQVEIGDLPSRPSSKPTPADPIESKLSSDNSRPLEVLKVSSAAATPDLQVERVEKTFEKPSLASAQEILPPSPHPEDFPQPSLVEDVVAALDELETKPAASKASKSPTKSAPAAKSPTKPPAAKSPTKAAPAAKSPTKQNNRQRNKETAAEPIEEPEPADPEDLDTTDEPEQQPKVKDPINNRRWMATTSKRVPIKKQPAVGESTGNKDAFLRASPSADPQQNTKPRSPTKSPTKQSATASELAAMKQTASPKKAPKSPTKAALQKALSEVKFDDNVQLDFNELKKSQVHRAKSRGNVVPDEELNTENIAPDRDRYDELWNLLRTVVFETVAKAGDKWVTEEQIAKNFRMHKREDFFSALVPNILISLTKARRLDYAVSEDSKQRVFRAPGDDLRTSTRRLLSCTSSYEGDDERSEFGEEPRTTTTRKPVAMADYQALIADDSPVSADSQVSAD